MFAAVIVAIAGGGSWLLFFASASGTQLAPRLTPATPPGPTPGPLVLRPIQVAAPANPTAAIDAATHGTVTIATRPPSTCTIAGLRLQTPIVRLDIAEGAYAVSCVEETSGRSVRFGVIVRAGGETRDVGHVLPPLPAPASRP